MLLRDIPREGGVVEIRDVEGFVCARLTITEGRGQRMRIAYESMVGLVADVHDHDYRPLTSSPVAATLTPDSPQNAS